MIKAYEERIETHVKEYNEWKWLRDYMERHGDCGEVWNDSIAGMMKEGRAITELLEKISTIKNTNKMAYTEHMSEQRAKLKAMGKYRW